MLRNKVGIFLVFLILVITIDLLTINFLKWDFLSVNFFNCRLIEILRLLVMIFLSCYVAYWVSIKSNAIQKKKDLCLVLINEGNLILSEQKELTLFVYTANKQ
ncbi:unknown protein [Desulfotalea psychrophila LSv54]|uniref:Uncharacterized protein n=1 Tax=Desulfotalea psychrophila (strain LSv54 / DSM 12343) TaxID=177439 RepID=Q6AM63_DESPS|nr:unknown protein [Desulfotalea psychrophila LSv54]